MKKYVCCLLSIIILFSITAMSGCSDFSFNPLGTWEYYEEIYYIDGEEVERVGQEDMMYKSMKYIFEKSGTGYITVSDSRTLDFTYDYNDKGVTVYVNTPKTSDSSKESSDDTSTGTKYRLYNDEKNNLTELIRTEEYKADDDNGEEDTVKVEHIFVKL